MVVMMVMMMMCGGDDDGDEGGGENGFSRGVTGGSEEVTSTPPAHESITSLPVAFAQRARVAPRAQAAGEPHECERADRGQERLP